MDARRGEILNSTWDIFLRYGIRSISMDDLSQRLGISKKTVYQYVGNKTELVEQVLCQQHEDDVRKLRHLGSNKHNAIDYLLEMSRAICQSVSRINPALVYDLKKYYPLITKHLIKTKRQFYMDIFIKNYQDGVAQGFYRDDLNQELTVRLYIRNIEQFFGEDLSAEAGISTSEVFKVMFENHLHSIANPIGLKYFEQKKQSFDYNL